MLLMFKRIESNLTNKEKDILKKCSDDELLTIIRSGLALYKSMKETASGIESNINNHIVPIVETGIKGEKIIQDILKLRYTTINTAKESKKGDIVISSVDKTGIKSSLLVEVKNYSNTVPTSQLNKFYRDLATNTGVCGGVFISLKSKVTGYPSSFELIEQNIDGKLYSIVIISLKDVSDSEDIITTLVTMGCDILFAISSYKGIESHKANVDKVKVNYIREQLSTISNSRQCINELNLIVSKKTIEINNKLLIVENNIKNQLDCI